MLAKSAILNYLFKLPNLGRGSIANKKGGIRLTKKGSIAGKKRGTNIGFLYIISDIMKIPPK